MYTYVHICDVERGLEVKNTKEYRQKNFRGSRIIDTIEYIEKLTSRHQSLLEEYQQKAVAGDEGAKLLVEYEKGLTTMAYTIQSHLENLFEYDKSNEKERA